ncbi:2,3-diphosphoglycerate-dependent phosphoglycerate mutase [Candidatus Woesebacteria bacterium]|nr:2,3-diphosphoglycerate-dependent phosphoglycerate mutase [Candidatus Woesebacteria bacterium]
MAYLILVRHGQSTWNLKGTWTGWNDVDITKQGEEEAKEAARIIKKLTIRIDKTYQSDLKRAQQTLDILKRELGIESIPTVTNAAIKERDYGVYAGKNKWEIKKEVGDETFLKIRRSWDYPIPEGENLKQVWERVAPYYDTVILPDLEKGLNVLVSAHGNSLRALVKHLDNVSPEEVTGLNIGTGEVYVYQIDTDGTIMKKDIYKVNTQDQ